MEESVTLLTTATKDVNGNSRPTNDVSSESTSLKEEKVYQEYNLEGIGKDAISFQQILKTMPGETENGWEVIANLQNAVPFNDGLNGTDTMAVVMGTNNSNLAGNGIDGSQRRESRSSLATTVNMDVCRICHCESEPGAPLISPCVCSGSLKYVHQSCLQQWIKSANTKSCELCKCDFSMTTKIKPFRKWQKLEMSTVERRKIMCSVTFHVIAITCVIWSLYVLIDKTTQEIRQGLLEWPFWTKLIVVAIGFTGGLVFMYVQCKMYVQLCRRWKAYNRVIFIQNLPDGNAHKIPKQPVYTQAKVQSSQNHSSLYSDVDLL